MNWTISHPAHLLEAIKLSMSQGGNFLKSRVAPTGPIAREPNVNYIHKASWGMYASGVDHETIAILLDWVEQKALRENGDFFFNEEPSVYKDMQRLYRPLTFGKVAAWIGHPVIEKPVVIDRILQYQHHPSGGVFNYIGNDPKNVEQQATIGPLNTTFFGHLMVALDFTEQAVKAGEWCRRFVEANWEHMSRGVIYTQMTPTGDLITEVALGEKMIKVVDRDSPKQEFWHIGTLMAYFCTLYDTMVSRWGFSGSKAQPYLDAALELLEFESAMPLDTYLWPSKCKVAWGAGELLRVLVKHQSEDKQSIDKAYRICERVAIFTFMDNQLGNGGWPSMHYPTSELAPETDLTYKPLKGLVHIPQQATAGSQSFLLPGEEITGEFLGEMKSVEQGVEGLISMGR